jgi:diaminopimelate epimerase
MKFAKLHGLGNDFVLTYDECPENFIQYIANRKYGIGCDQVISLNSHRAVFWNSDGSRARFCGNGCRAIFRYLGKNGTIETDSGTVTGELIDSNIRIKYPYGRILSIENGVYLVDVGNLHKIHFREIDLECENFEPNVNNMYLTWNNGWNMSIYEAGVGQTEACGSGAMAASLAIWDRDGYLPIYIKMRGGKLYMERVGDQLLQTGPAHFVYSGEISIDQFIVSSITNY